MRFWTAYEWQEQSGLSLVLQQTCRQKGEQEIVFAGIFEEEKGKGQEAVAGRMTDWFYEKALVACDRRGAKNCVDAARKLFAKEIAGMEKAGELRADSAFVVWFAFGEECFYAWRGAVQLQLIHLQFDRVHMRNLSRISTETTFESAVLEKGVGVLIGTEDFFAHLSKDVFRACLEVMGMDGERQVQRHLAEAAQEAVRRGAKAPAVLLAVAGEEKRWRES